MAWICACTFMGFVPDRQQPAARSYQLKLRAEVLYQAFLFLVAFLLGLNGATVACAEDWPGWRKDGSGESRETGIPQSWNPTENIRWKTAIPGEGLSSPIVWKDRVFVTSAVLGTTRHFLFYVSVTFLW